MEVVVSNGSDDQNGLRQRIISTALNKDEEKGNIKDDIRVVENGIANDDKQGAQEDHRDVHDCKCHECEREAVEIKRTIDGILAWLNTLKAKSVDFTYKWFPWLARLIFGANGLQDLTSIKLMRKLSQLLNYALWTMATFIMLLILWTVFFYVRTSIKPPITYIMLPIDGKDMYDRRWDMAPCKKTSQPEFDLGKATVVSNQTHVLYVNLDMMILSQQHILMEQSNWTDVVCASMIGPSNNISMPCACSLMTENGVISGFNFHVAGFSKSKISIVELVPVMGHTEAVQHIIPKSITLGYYDITMRNNTEIMVEGPWVSTSLRAIALMNNVDHYKQLIK